MKAEIKQLWTEALRSGQYKQARHKLRDGQEDRFCCLGVLCDLHSKATGNSRWSKVGGFRCAHYETEFSVLPTTVMRWAGIDSSTGEVVENGIKRTLTKMNDGGYSFAGIADTIERCF